MGVYYIITFVWNRLSLRVSEFMKADTLSCMVEHNRFRLYERPSDLEYGEVNRYMLNPDRFQRVCLHKRFGSLMVVLAIVFGSAFVPAYDVQAAEVSPSTAPIAQPGSSPELLIRENPYDASAEIEQSKARLAQGVQPAHVISAEEELTKKASITLDGMLDKETMRSLIELLGQHDIKTSFFPTGLQAAESPDVISAIVSAGYPIGNYTLRGDAHMEAFALEELVENFTASQKILREISGLNPTQLKGNAIEYTDDVLMAAAASGIAHVVQSSAYLTYHSFKSYEETLGWVNRLDVGSIITVKLSGALDSSEYQPQENVEKPALDMTSTLVVEDRKSVV